MECKSNFVMEDRMKLNLPGAIIDLPTVTDKDADDIQQFGLENNIDIILASFVRRASDIESLRNDVLGQKGANVKIIAKIETHEGLHNFEEILAEADGIMIARHDLSMEIPPEKVFIAQKWMTEKCNLAAKPCMITSQVFSHMCKNARPTRAEASDVSNAVLDGVDAITLTEETCIGDYPINAVSMLAKCTVEAEKTVDHKKVFNDSKLYSPAPYGTAESVACAAVASVIDLKVDLIVVMTETGKLARLVSKYRPQVAVVCCSSSDYVVRHMNIQSGVFGIQSGLELDMDSQIAYALEEARKMKVCKAGNKVVVIHGSNEDSPDETNVMKVLTVE